MRQSAGFVAHILSTPLPDVLEMKLSDFVAWREVADEIFEATRVRFG